MLRCWKYLPTDRPTFAELVQTVDNILSKAVDNVSGITLFMFRQLLIASLTAETVADWDLVKLHYRSIITFLVVTIELAYVCMWLC